MHHIFISVQALTPAWWRKLNWKLMHLLLKRNLRLTHVNFQTKLVTLNTPTH